MKKRIDEILDGVGAEEADSLLCGIEEPGTDILSSRRIAKAALAKAGVGSSAHRSRISVKTLLRIAACAVLVLGLTAGAIAYAADAREFVAAKAFLEQNNISSDGLSRAQIKTVFRDILNRRFADPETNTILLNNLNSNGAAILRSDDAPMNYNNLELWNMTTSMNSLLPGERMLGERELFLWPTNALGFYQGAGGFCIGIEGVTAELSCDHAYVGKSFLGSDSFVLLDASHVSTVFVMGRGYRDGDWSLMDDNAAVRILLKNEGGDIVGYALVCFWAPLGAQMPSFENGSVVKAVMLEDGLTLSETEAEQRLDEAYSSLVIQRELFKTESSIGLMWNDWYERNSEWYWSQKQEA
ncbi:MAG: hypothetical protein J5586_02530 [Clostridia bacterium]|nr:hypothetical protein [Clostridia bacterium]